MWIHRKGDAGAFAMIKAVVSVGVALFALTGSAFAQNPGAAGDEASFDCARATTQVEKEICASPVLRRLDRQIAFAYRAALVRHGQSESVEALRDDQRQFNSIRERAGMSASAQTLQQMMESRRDTLRRLSGSRTVFVGRWTSYNGDITITQNRAGLVVSISTVDPVAGRWTCAGDGPLTVSRDMRNAGVLQLGEGWSLAFVLEGGALSVTTRKPPGATDENPYCGMDGAFDGLYLAAR